MKIEQTRTFAASPDRVWAALLSPDVLRDCIPGCTSVTGSPEAGFDAEVSRRIGPFPIAFRGRIDVTQSDPHRHCRMKGEGQGGAAGLLRGMADVTLRPEGPATHLTCLIDAEVDGRIARFGGALLDAAALRFTDRFFDRIAAAVEESGRREG